MSFTCIICEVNEVSGIGKACKNCAVNMSCIECRRPIGRNPQRNENNEWACSDCVDNPEFEVCKACLDVPLTPEDQSGLCTNCFNDKAKFFTECRQCEDQFPTRDVLLLECAACERDVGVCERCRAHFQSPDEHTTICEVCRITHGCLSCGIRQKEIGNYCVTCDFNISNRICTECDKPLLIGEITGIYGECTSCTDRLPNIGPNHTCLWCHTNPPTSDLDFLCDRCRKNLRDDVDINNMVM